MKTTISITKKNERLAKLGNKDDSFENIITKLLDFKKIIKIFN